MMYVYYIPEFNCIGQFSRYRGDVAWYPAETFSLELERAGSKRKTEIHYIGEF